MGRNNRKNRRKRKAQASKQSRQAVELDEDQLELEPEEANYAVVHWMFDQQNDATLVYSLLKLAAEAIDQRGQYAAAFEPTNPPGDPDVWVVGISCEIPNGASE